MHPNFYPELRLRNTHDTLIKSTLRSILAIYSAIVKPSAIIKTQIKTDIVSLMKTFAEFEINRKILQDNQNQAVEFVCSFTEDEMTGLSTITKSLDRFPLRDLKGLYLWNNKDDFSIGSLL